MPFKSYESANPNDKYICLTYSMMDSEAFRSLSGDAVKLYVYMKMLADGKDKFDFATALGTQIGLSKKAYFRARNELIGKGFIEGRA